MLPSCIVYVSLRLALTISTTRMNLFPGEDFGVDVIIEPGGGICIRFCNSNEIFV